MIYHYYIEPAALKVEAGNSASLLNLLNFLRGLCDNVLIAVFDDDHLRSEFAEAVGSIEDPDIQKKIKGLLARLMKRNRFTYSIETDYNGAKDDLQCVVEQFGGLQLDAIIAESPVESYGIPVPDGVVFTLHTYGFSHLEEERSALASKGRMYLGGEESVEVFLRRNFERLLRYAGSVTICDKLLGEKCGTRNWQESVQALLAYIETINEDAARCAIEIHTSCPKGEGKDHIKQWVNHGLKQLQPKIRLYGSEGAKVNFHHDRFIMTDQFVIMVTTGFDLLNVAENCNRGTNLDYKGEREVADSLAQAERSHPSVVI